MQSVDSTRTQAKNKQEELDAGNVAMPAASKSKPKKAVLDGRYSAVKKQMGELDGKRDEYKKWVAGKDAGTSDITEQDTAKMMADGREIATRYGTLFANFNTLAIEYNSLTGY